jgi:hypothetical protein
MDLGLKVLGGVPAEPKTHLVSPGRRFLLGRHPPEQGIDLQLLVVSVNRRHCEVWRDEAGVWVNDLQSRNGTFVNGEAVMPGSATLLRACDSLQLGPVRLRLACLGPLDPAWLRWDGGAIVGLARSIRETNWAGQGVVLHDALLDAGCADAELLGHCRAGCPHGTDCTLLELFLDGG